MPAHQSAQRRQKALLFPLLGIGSDGDPVYGSPLELDVRWSQVEEELVSARGTPVTINARVVVDREIEQGSAMWKGKLVDWDDALKGKLMYVRAYKEVPDTKAREYYREVLLSKLREDL